MNRIFFLLVLGAFIFSGCGLRQREMELDKKLADVNEKEQQLSLKEQSLDFREQQLDVREKILDSTTKKIANDSLNILYPQLPGTWFVKMFCTETNCPGSAVGDVKNEQWDFKIQDNSIIASAISNNQLVRVYTGFYTTNSIRLSVQQDSTDAQPAKMTVRLQNITDKDMDGEREIIQPNGCRILYSLQLKKQIQK